MREGCGPGRLAGPLALAAPLWGREGKGVTVTGPGGSRAAVGRWGRISGRCAAF